ncbi:uncharacterized protein LOC115158052 [Salmo trutta]|uniref:uncharacterized protein LOC115158052 n=1 Tax=Salmo trutta TaxID=8032 RepID=UPI001132517C|nr:uncharacterized protein LOC115158052 [Salmo trutta]
MEEMGNKVKMTWLGNTSWNLGPERQRLGGRMRLFRAFMFVESSRKVFWRHRVRNQREKVEKLKAAPAEVEEANNNFSWNVFSISTHPSAVPMLLHLSPQDTDSLMQDLREVLGSFTGPDCHVTPKVTWAERQTLCAQKWGGERERQWSTACSLLKEQVYLLPMAMPQQCVFPPAPQRPDSDEWQAVILIGINGCYKLSLPDLNCSGCLRYWRVGLDELVKSGYWPATMTYQTIFTVDLFKSFEDIKLLAPRCSRHAFLGMLDGRTKHFGRSGKICGGTFQKPFL